MQLTIIRDLSDFEGISDAWQALLAEDSPEPPGMDPTSGMAWSESLIEAFLAAGEWWVLVATDERGVAGILPVYRRRAVDTAASAGAMAQLSVLHGGRCGFLVRGGRPETLRVLIDGLDQITPEWSTLDLQVVEGGRSEGMVAALSGDNARIVSVRSESSAIVEIGDDFEAFSRSLKSGLRTELRRRERRLSESGQVVLRFYDQPQQVDEYWRAVTAIEAGSWKAAAGTAITSRAYQGAFYRALLPRMAEAGEFLGAIMYVDEVPVAHRVAIGHRGVVVSLKTSYQQAWKAHAPATLLTWHYLQEIHRRGFHALDFSGAADESKLRWGSKTYRHLGFRLFSRSLAGRMAYVRHAAASSWRRLDEGRKLLARHEQNA